jgi:hypothetical protein
VFNQKVMFTLISFFGDHLKLEFQLLNRIGYKVIIPNALSIVAVPKFLKPFIRMGFEIDPARVICKFRKQILVEGISGFYAGEFDIKTNLPDGRGVFQGENGIRFLGYFEEGKFGAGKCVRIDSKAKEYSVCTQW